MLRSPLRHWLEAVFFDDLRFSVFALLCGAAILWLAAYPFYSIHVRKWGLRLGAWMCSLLIAIGFLLYGFLPLFDRGFDYGDSVGQILSLFARGALPLLVVPLAIKLYWALIGGPLSDGERKPGRECLRSWLRISNIVLCSLIALCAWKGLGYNFWGVFALSAGALAAYPAFSALSNMETKERTMEEDLGRERERILNMLEEGKITAEESADLLQALTDGAKESVPRLRRPVAPWHKWMIAGAALVAVSFLLPWARVNLAKEMQRGLEAAGMGDMGAMLSEQMGRMQQQIGSNPFAGSVENDAMFGDNVRVQTNVPRFSMSDSGSLLIYPKDLKNGLGWLILFLALAAAALPFFEDWMSLARRRKTASGALAVGALLVAYLFLGSLRHTHIGIILAIIGYAVALGGGLKTARTV